MTTLKNYQQNKARHKMCISKTDYTKHYETLKAEAKEQGRTSLEFCVWFDYEIASLCNLSISPFDTIIQLVNDGHIINDKKLKYFRLACIIFQKFVKSDHSINMRDVDDFLKDNPQYKKQKVYNYGEEYPSNGKRDIYDYENKDTVYNRIFPYFSDNKITRKLIAIMIKRGFLSYDDKKHNLVYVCQNETTILGVEMHGMLEKDYMFPEYAKTPFPFMYWNEYSEHVVLKEEIKQVIFYDKTLYMIQDISSGSRDDTLYCSLFNDKTDMESYKNVLELLSEKIKICFNFSDKEKEQAFIDKIKEQESKEREVVVIIEPTIENSEEGENTLAWLDDEEDEIMPF